MAEQEAPPGWQDHRLGQLGTWLSGGTPSKSAPDLWNGDIPWVSPKDMKRPRLWDALDHISQQAIGKGGHLAPAEALLMVVRGMILAHSAPVARAETSLAFNQDIKALVLSAKYDSNFMLWWLSWRQNAILNIATESTHGTKRIPTDSLFDMTVPLPPLPEQRAIATALSDVDDLLAGLDRLIAKKRAIKQGVMHDLLTGRTRLPGFSGKWEPKRLGDVATFHKGKGLPKTALSPYGSEQCVHYGELFTHYGEAISETISRTNKAPGAFRSLANDVLMPTSDVTPRGLAKASCVLVDDVVLGGDILVIRTDPSQISGTFLSHVIRREDDQVLRLVTGTTVFHIYGADMKKFHFKVPPLPEQRAIAAVLTDLDDEIDALQARRDKTIAIKQAMMAELLTGRTRLV